MTDGDVQVCLRSSCRFVNDLATEPVYCRRCGAPMLRGFCVAVDETSGRRCGDMLLGPDLVHAGLLLHRGPPRVLRDGVEVAA